MTRNEKVGAQYRNPRNRRVRRHDAGTESSMSRQTIIVNDRHIDPCEPRSEVYTLFAIYNAVGIGTYGNTDSQLDGMPLLRLSGVCGTPWVCIDIICE